MKKLFFHISIITLLFLAQSCHNNIEKELTFLTFNVWQEGTSVPNGLTKIHEIITAVNPDVVCFVEVRNYKDQDWTSKIIAALAESHRTYYRGYAGGDVSLISKYPLENGKQLFENSDQGTIVNFQLNVDGNFISVFGAHLDYTYYASNLPRGYNGSDPDWNMIDDGEGQPLHLTNLDTIEAYNLRSTRDEAINAFVSTIKTESIPIVLMGDFNEPSFLDWTEKTKDLFDHNGVVMPWQNTKKLDEVGFVDVFRTFYPNEEKNPGFTWPSYANDIETTSWSPLADERDRIDYIFYKGEGITIKNVAIVGPKASYVHNLLETSNTEHEKFVADQLPWPSDHKAILAQLNFTFTK